uniref:Ribosome production factor 2 homolog n=1 Tax=Cyprinus carpio TaxID=7962 RepID=A0A8C2BZV6_CYPCA
MAHRDGIVKAKTRRSKRFLQSREPKLVEGQKSSMIIRGGNTSETVSQALKDVVRHCSPSELTNMVRPFDDSTALEFFSKKSDCSLFLFGSHNKKRPNNLVFGRMFDFHVLDMFELGIERFVSLRDVKTDTCPEGTKPMLVFSGELFETDREHQRLRNLLTDFFCGPRVSAVRLAGLEHVLHFTALEGKIYMRSYKVLLKKSGCRTPRIQLQDMGPSFDLVMRRSHMASDDLYRTAHKKPRGAKPKKKKNISHDAFGTRLGRLHMQKQDLDKLQTRKMKGLRKRRGGQTAETPATKAPRTDE